MGEPLIEFKNVHKSFDSLHVLQGVNLVIEEGVVTTIIGRSGIGKSVMLRHIVGLLMPDKGEILYHNRSLKKMKRSERKALKGKFSYMFQNMALFDSLTIFENIALPLKEKTRFSRVTIRRKVMDKISQLELHDIEDKYPSQISGGMCRRVALARALITEPEIVLFDEPTTGLDPIRKNTVLRMIDRYQQKFGFTAVIVSHDIPHVFDVSQRVAMLDRGEILFVGTPEELMKTDSARVQNFILGKEEWE